MAVKKSYSVRKTLDGELGVNTDDFLYAKLIAKFANANVYIHNDIVWEHEKMIDTQTGLEITSVDCVYSTSPDTDIVGDEDCTPSVPTIIDSPTVGDDAVGLYSVYWSFPVTTKVYVRVNGGGVAEAIFDSEESYAYQYTHSTNFVAGDRVEYWQTVDGTESNHAVCVAEYPQT